MVGSYLFTLCQLILGSEFENGCSLTRVILTTGKCNNTVFQYTVNLQFSEATVSVACNKSSICNLGHLYCSLYKSDT